MGIFDFLKKNKDETHYDPTNITIRDLGKEYIFEYATETWTVTSLFEYDWGDNFFTREFIIKSGAVEKFLNIEEDDGLTVTLTEKVKIRKLGDEVCDYIDKHEKPPKKISFEGVVYYLDEKSPGYCKEIDASNWEELISYNYLDEEEEKVLCIEQFGDEAFKVSKGVVIDELAISNILPVKDKY